MLVASGVEFGDVCMADPGQQSQLIGHIESVIGCGTLRRANGNAVQVMAHLLVREGDVIETAADGWIAIRLIDGTVLNLPGGTCAELGELASDSGNTPRSAGSTLVFTGGALAKPGSAAGDAAVNRSGATAGGFGLLSLTALTFSLVQEARAADPDVTILDDDHITYKDLHHGVFELVTKEAVPRHIIVEDPGETVVITRQGSSVSVSQVTNSPARMEELRAIQQAALANYEKGWESIGSGTTPFDKSQLLQPINFDPDNSPLTPQNSLAPLPGSVIPPIEFLKLLPQPPVLNLGVSPTKVDTFAFDDFASESGTFAASTTDGGTLTFGIGGGVADNEVLGNRTYDVSATGAFGTLYLNSATGDYTFVPNNQAINALKTNATQNFIITVSDGTLSASQTFSIPITGADDSAIISGTTGGRAVGAVGVIDASPGLLIATGTLTDTDVDDPANTFTAVSTPTKSIGGYGTFTMTTGGVWTYTLDNANSSVQALNVGEKITDSFTVTTIGGTPEQVTVTIHGPLIGATGAGPPLALSETHLTAGALTTTAADFSAAFTMSHDIDGTTVSYALTIAGGSGTASGLIDSHTGLADVLVLDGNTIEGRVGSTGGALAFAITVDPATGVVTFTEYRAVLQPLGSAPGDGESVSLAAGLVSLVATVTDSDGEFQSASVDLGSRLTIADDEPSIAATGTAPSLVLSETHLPATVLDDNIAGSAPDAALTATSADFAAAFVAEEGADGATISYALTLAAGDGTASGLVDSHTGLADVLVLNGNTIEGRVGNTSGTLAFTIALDPATGLVTFTEYRAVKQPLGTNPDSGEGLSLTSGIVGLVATITDTDGDSQTASLDLGSRLTITDDGPTIGTTGAAPSLTLSETHLPATTLNDNIAGSAPNAALTSISANFSSAFTSSQGADGATISYALTIAGGNGTASGLIDSHTCLPDVLVQNGNTIEGRVGSTTGALAFTIALDPATGLVTFTEYRAVEQPLGTNPDSGEGLSLTSGIVSLIATITDKDGDFQTANLDLGGRLTITDDGPTIGMAGTAPSLTLSEKCLTAISADFSAAFNSSQGADGATIGYALAIAGGDGTASGLIDSHTCLPDVLVLNGNTIEGRVGCATGDLAFTVALDPDTGLVTFTQYRAIEHPLGTNPDSGEGLSLTSGIVSLIATITDKDGDFQTANLDLGSRLTITDDGPTIETTGTAPTLTLSEKHLTAICANFSSAFTSSQGADGATIGYELTITGGDGTASGLIDSHTGLADVLVLNGNTIEGRVGCATGELAFTIALNPETGLVTFTGYRAVKQPFGTDPDHCEGVSLTAGLVSLVATITDKDGDFETASIDLGKQLTIADDGPTIGGFKHAVVSPEHDHVAACYDVDFGADGDAAMLLAVHNGAVGNTGFNLAVSSLGGGISSVHVTGNDADYTFYYSTHAVHGGVELNAYLTNSNGTLADPYFKLLINPDGTYCFDLDNVKIVNEATATGSDFGASGDCTPSLTSPDGQLIITGSDDKGHSLDVKASSNGIAVGDSGSHMDPCEQLNLSFLQEQSHVSFILTQWQGSGTANVTFTAVDGDNDIHCFNINIPKPPGGIANIMVQETSDASLIDTSTFDATTSTYTLYVGHQFDQIQVDYDHAKNGYATFTVNNIHYDAETHIPNSDLLFDVSAFDRDGDSATTNLQVDIKGCATETNTLASTLDSQSMLPASDSNTATMAAMTAAASASDAAGATSGAETVDTSRTLGDSFYFKDEMPGSGESGAPVPAALDLGPAWLAHHEDAMSALVSAMMSGTASAIEPSALEHHPDGSLLTSDHPPNPLLNHAPHDLIV